MSKVLGPKSYFDFTAPTIIGADIRTWFRFLWRYGGDIDWRFWPRIFVLTFPILFYTPIVWWERFRFGRKIRETKVKAPIFIIGHQRSGTTYLNYLMCRDEQFGYLTVKESFMPWIYLTAKRHLEWMLGRAIPEKRPMDNLKLGLDLPTEPEYALGNMTVSTMLAGYMIPKRLYSVFRKTVLFDDACDKEEWKHALRYFMQKLTLKNDGKQLIIKAPENLGRVKEILEIFPDAKFIHIHRDPYRVYFSTERLYGITLPLVAMQYCSEDVVKDFIMRSYREMFDRYFEAKRLIPKGNLTEVRYDDLIGCELSELERVYNELSLEGFEAAKPFIKQEVKTYENYQTNTYNYPPERMAEIYSAWESVFDELGYAEN
ncbi:MAG: sulfotransferase [Flavobacteriales bacterium]|nr:sulfotransferase [Flavobacteriales bacterium]